MQSDTRRGELTAWYRQWSGNTDAQVEPLAGDASFRRYFRVRGVQASLILCDAPPEKEKNREFVYTAGVLAEHGVRVPRVHGADLERGFLVLEDLGDTTLLPLLSAANVDNYYHRALKMLIPLARVDCSTLDFPDYSADRLREEMDLFPHWFCEQMLGIDMHGKGHELFVALVETLTGRALAQARVLVHRDYHSRNLMVLDSGELAVIDFQDAVCGPLTYDAVSLLRDCYVRWPEEQVRRWALAYHQQLGDAGIRVPDAEAFLVDFDWMGLQRHIKVLGIFCRLYLRDGKAGYLPDLPRVLAYVRSVLGHYPGEPAIARFSAWLEETVVPRAVEASWFRES